LAVLIALAGGCSETASGDVRLDYGSIDDVRDDPVLVDRLEPGARQLAEIDECAEATV
jgi:hypothetical protein